MRVLILVMALFFVSPIAFVAPRAAEAAAPAAKDEFTQKMNEINELEAAGDFRQAMLLLRRMRQQFRDAKQVLAIDDAMERVRRLGREGVGAKDAFEKLGSSDRRASDVAKKELLSSGPAGSILLRKALQTGNATAANNAAEALAEARDAEAIPVLLERLSAEKGRTPLALTVMGSLVRLQNLMTVEQLAECDKVLEEAEGISRCEMASVLLAALDRRAEGKREAYDKLIGRPGAYERLREAIARAVISGEEALVTWACTEGTAFLPNVRGFHATYYSDPGFVNTALERFEPTIEKKPEESFPYPNGQKTTLSVRWDADLKVGAPGEYVFGIQADDSGTVYLNGSNVVSTWAGQVRGSQGLNLTAGVYRIRVDYIQEQDAAHCKVWWTGPGFRDVLDLPVSTRPLPEQMIKLSKTLGDLVSTNWAASRAVKDRVLSGGEAGRMVLRDAIVKREEPVALAAMEFLAIEFDGEMIPSLVRRSADPKMSPRLRTGIAEAMRSVASKATEADCRSMLAALKGDGGPDKHVAMAGLCAVLERCCGGNEEAFNKLCGKPDAHATLKAFMARLFDSKQPEDAMWLAAFAQPFVMKPNGLHGRYWRGSRNDQFVFERTDGQLDFYERVPPLTDGGNQELSGTWEGFLWVPANGEYKFFLRGQNDARLWVDDQWLMHNGWRHNDVVVARSLSKGSHRIRGTLRFWHDSPAMHLQWEGPNMPKQFVPWWCLQSAPPMSAVTNAVAALPKIPGLTNPEVALPVYRAVNVLGGAAAPLLLQVIRDGEETVAIAALGVFLELPVQARDERATATLVARSEKVASAPFGIALGDALREVATSMTGEDCKRMLVSLESGSGMARDLALAGLCAVIDRVCEGKAEGFNKLCGDEQAYDDVRSAVARIISEGELAQIAWISSFGQPFVPRMPGVRVRYWRGRQFDLPAIDRREESIHQYERIPGITEQNPVELSARWEGYLGVPAEGDYRFIVAAQNEGKLWIDGKQIHVQSGHRGQEGAATVKLTPGRHAIKAELKFWNDWPGMRVWWEGPNMQRQIVGAPYLSMDPMPELVLDAAKSLAKMRGLYNISEYVNCRRSVQVLGEAAEPMLKRLVKDGPRSPSFGEALRFLIEMGSESTVPVLVEQLKTNQALRVNTDMIEAMVQLVSGADSNTLAWCLKEVREARSPDMDACLATLCRVYLLKGGGDPGPFNRLLKDPKAYETIKTASAAALRASDLKVLGRALRFGQPFASTVGGATARYYFGDRFDRLHVEQSEWAVRLWEYRGPQGWRDENISATYDGFINSPNAGDFVFRLNARGEGTLWVDGKPVIASAGGREDAKNVNLASGWHTFRFAMRQPGKDFSFFLDTDRTPMNGNRVAVDGNLVSSPPSQSLIAALERAVGELDEKAHDKVSAARALLNGSGNPGLAFIRHTALNAAEPKAATMAGMLISQRPDDASDVILAMMKGNPKSESMPTYVVALSAVAEQIGDRDAQWIYDGTKDTTGLDERQQLQILAAIADRACLGDKKRFDAMVKAKAGSSWDAVEKRVSDLANSVDTNDVFWAIQNGGPFVPKVPGVRGKFYDGQAFDRPYADMREECVDRQNEPFHNHGNPVSAWWTGTFGVPQAGRFRIKLRADDFARLWIDGRLIVDGWTSGTGQELWGDVDLTPGVHTLDVRYRQIDRDRYVFASIQGPGLNQRFDRNIVSCVPPHGSIEWLYKELEKLGTDNQVQEGMNAAGQWRPLSDFFLRGMVRFGVSKKAERAAGILGDWRDKEAKPLILKRAASTPDANLKKALEDAAKKIP